MTWIVSSTKRNDRISRRHERLVGTAPLDALWVCDISLREIRFGAELRADSVERITILEWLDTVVRPLFGNRCLYAGEECRLRWKFLEAEGRRQRHAYPQPDLVIAAIALDRPLTVVTRDARPFEKAGVPVLNPWRPA